MLLTAAAFLGGLFIFGQYHLDIVSCTVLKAAPILIFAYHCFSARKAVRSTFEE